MKDVVKELRKFAKAMVKEQEKLAKLCDKRMPIGSNKARAVFFHQGRAEMARDFIYKIEEIEKENGKTI